MGVPTSEVGYTPAMPRREDHEVHKGHVAALGGGGGKKGGKKSSFLRTVRLSKEFACRILFVCLFLARQPPPPVGQDLLIHEVSRSHTTTHHSRWDSSKRVISSSQRPLHNTHSRRPCLRWDSNPQSQHASGRRPTP